MARIGGGTARRRAASARCRMAPRGLCPHRPRPPSYGMALFAGPGHRRCSAAPVRPAAHRAPTTRWAWTPGTPPIRARAAHSTPSMVFLSFPDSRPLTTPEELAADHFPATSDFFARASYGRFPLRPTRSSTGSGCPRRPPRTAYSATGTPATARPTCATRSPPPTRRRLLPLRRRLLRRRPGRPRRRLGRDEGRQLRHPDAGRRHRTPPARHGLRAAPAGPQRPRPRDRTRLRPARPLSPARGRQGRLGHLRRRLGPHGQPVRTGARPLRLAQVEARLARPAASQRACRPARGPTVHTLRPLGAGPLRCAAARPAAWRWSVRASTRRWPWRPAAPRATTAGCARRACWSTGCAATAPRRRPGQGGRRAPGTTACWERLGLPAAGGRAARRGRELHDATAAGAMRVEVTGQSADGGWRVKVNRGDGAAPAAAFERRRRLPSDPGLRKVQRGGRTPRVRTAAVPPSSSSSRASISRCPARRCFPKRRARRSSRAARARREAWTAFTPARGEPHAADAGIAGVGDALGVAESLELGDRLGSALLGHVQLGGELPDGRLRVDEVLEDVAVGEAQIAEALGSQLVL